MASVMFEGITKSKKLKILFTNLILPHFVACLLNSFLIVIQNFLNQSCYMNGVCDCNDDLKIKIFNYLKDFASIWFFILYLSYCPIFHVKLMLKNTPLKILFWVFQGGNFAFFYMRSDGNEDFSTNVVQFCLYTGVSINLFLQFYYIWKLKFNFGIWFKNCVKAAPNMVIAANDFVNIMLFGFVRNFLSSNFSERNGNNIMDLLIMLYLQILLFALNKTLNFQFEVLEAEEEEDEANFVITFAIRYCCSYIVAINMLAISRRSLDQWGTWFLIISYVLFLVKSYTRINFVEKIFWKFYNDFQASALGKLVKRRKVNKTNMNSLKFQKIYSGCMLDVQLVFCLRFIIMYLTKRWSVTRGYSMYYKNCQYQILEEKFLINYWSVMGIFLLNAFILALIFWSMLYKKSIIFSYLKIRKPWLNLYVLFGIHCVLEVDIQQYCFALFGA